MFILVTAIVFFMAFVFGTVLGIRLGDKMLDETMKNLKEVYTWRYNYLELRINDLEKELTETRSSSDKQRRSLEQTNP